MSLWRWGGEAWRRWHIKCSVYLNLGLVLAQCPLSGLYAYKNLLPAFHPWVSLLGFPQPFWCTGWETSRASIFLDTEVLASLAPRGDTRLAPTDHLTPIFRGPGTSPKVRWNPVLGTRPGNLTHQTNKNLGSTGFEYG